MEIANRAKGIAKVITGRLNELTLPVDPEVRRYMDERWKSLPEHLKTDSQVLGRHAVGCEGTHGVFPRCNFACTPCYHSKDANSVRVDGEHTTSEIEKQLSFLRKNRGPKAHIQLIGGEVSLLEPDDHAKALQIMRSYGREPMSFTHGDFDYDYLKKLVLDATGKVRLNRLSFAGHFDTTMRGRKGIVVPKDEKALDPYRKEFADKFKRLKKEHGVRYYLAHNMTVTPRNVDEIPEILANNIKAGYNMFSFQPAAFVGNDKRWKEDYSSLDPDNIWALMEEGAGAHLDYKILQTGDERCNRTAFGFYVFDKWLPVLSSKDQRDIRARDLFYKYLGGINYNTKIWDLLPRLIRVALFHPVTVKEGAKWLMRQVQRSGGTLKVIQAIATKNIVPMTFVMHRFMNAEDVKVAWDLMEQGIDSEEPTIKETQERLRGCFYAMAHPEDGRVVPACVQHSILDPEENIALSQLLPLPRRLNRRDDSVATSGASHD